MVYFLVSIAAALFATAIHTPTWVGSFLLCAIAIAFLGFIFDSRYNTPPRTSVKPDPPTTRPSGPAPHPPTTPPRYR